MSRKQSSNSYDPRKAEWNGTSIEDWEPSQWKQWKPKATGTDYPAVAEREYLRMRYTVQQANAQLDVDKVRVRLKLTSANAIGLQGTFPCKEGDVGKNGSPNKQYVISLGIPATNTGIKDAIARARELDRQLWTGAFKWTPELQGKQAQKIGLQDEEKTPKPINELIKEYEKEYWKTHEKNRQGINTWRCHYLNYLKKLPENEPLSINVLTQALDTTQPGTPGRKMMIWQLKKFCEFCGFDAVKAINTYITKRVPPKARQIPTDAEIVQGYHKIGIALDPRGSVKAVQPEQWQWIYGMLATYGLRPHEVYAIDLKAFTDPSNTWHLINLNPEITEGTKTGERNCLIPPLHPEWVELFDLNNIKPIQSEATLHSKSILLARRFRTTNIGFQPYNLRHAYAIRGHRLRFPVKTMADYMGHTVEEHTKTYQRWMSKDTNLEIYKEVISEKQTFTKENLKAENESLKAENESLKAENESLKTLLASHQLDGLLNY